MGIPETSTGPRRTCPACGSADLTAPRYCAPTARLRLGWWPLWPTPLCRGEGKHLHQRCRRCTYRFTCTPASPQLSA